MEATTATEAEEVAVDPIMRQLSDVKQCHDLLLHSDCLNVNMTPCTKNLAPWVVLQLHTYKYLIFGTATLDHLIPRSHGLVYLLYETCV